MDAKVADIFTKRGADVFYVRKSEPSFSHSEERKSRYNPDLAPEDAEALKKQCPSIEYVVSAHNANGKIRHRETVLENAWVNGRSWEYAFVENMDIEEGRHFSQYEDLRARYVAVIGADIKDKLFKGANPVGKNVYIKGKKFKVI